MQTMKQKIAYTHLNVIKSFILNTEFQAYGKILYKDAVLKRISL